MSSGENLTPPCPDARVALPCGQWAVKGTVCAISELRSQVDYAISLGLEPLRAVGISNVCKGIINGSTCRNNIIAGPEGSTFIESDAPPAKDSP